MKTTEKAMMNQMETESFAKAFLADRAILSDRLDQYAIFPGFCDVHVHFREPGFSYKETIATGSLAAARGGYTAVCTMPNLNPVPDSREHLAEQCSKISADARIHLVEYHGADIFRLGEHALYRQHYTGTFTARGDLRYGTGLLARVGGYKEPCDIRSAR